MQKLGVSFDAGRALADGLAKARQAEELGYDSIWMSQLPTNRDTATVLAAYALATERIRLGTAVLPIYTRHPTAAAQLAATLDELSHGRFVLGLGVSHKVTVESMWGLRLEHPAEAMREYLQIVLGLLRDGSANVDGAHFTAHSAYLAPRNPEQPVIISALAPRMLELAGEMADGVSLWMCTPGYIRDEVVPRVRAGREKAGKTLAGFEIEAAVPVNLTSDPAAAREAFRPTVQTYSSLPFYRRALDAAGFAEQLGRGEISDELIDELGGFGDENAVRAAVDRYREAGCTLPVIGPAKDFKATLELFSQ